jgi:hypothetical protein
MYDHKKEYEQFGARHGLTILSTRFWSLCPVDRAFDELQSAHFQQLGVGQIFGVFFLIKKEGGGLCRCRTGAGAVVETVLNIQAPCSIRSQRTARSLFASSLQNTLFFFLSHRYQTTSGASPRSTWRTARAPPTRGTFTPQQRSRPPLSQAAPSFGARVRGSFAPSPLSLCFHFVRTSEHFRPASSRLLARSKPCCQLPFSSPATTSLPVCCGQPFVILCWMFHRTASVSDVGLRGLHEQSSPMCFACVPPAACHVSMGPATSRRACL